MGLMSNGAVLEADKRYSEVKMPVLKEKRKERKGGAAILPQANATTAAAGRAGKAVTEAGALASFKAGYQGLGRVPALKNTLVRALLFGLSVAGLAFGVIKLEAALFGKKASKVAVFPARKVAMTNSPLPFLRSEKGLDVLFTNHMMVKPESLPQAKLPELPESGIEDMPFEQAELLAEDLEEEAEEKLFGGLSAKLENMLGDRMRDAIKPSAGFGSGPKVLDLAGGERIPSASGMLRAFDKGMFHKEKGKDGEARDLIAGVRHDGLGEGRGRGNGIRRSALSSRAIGQLKFANYASKSAYGSQGNDSAASYAVSAFSQSEPPSTGLNNTLSDTAKPITFRPTGGGRGGSSSASAEAPDVPAGKNVTPYQDEADEIEDLNDESDDLADESHDLYRDALKNILLAAVYFAAAQVAGVGTYKGTKLQKQAYEYLRKGLKLLTKGDNAKKESEKKADEADDLSDSVNDDYGQGDQTTVWKSATDSARNGDLEDFEAPPTKNGTSTVHDDVEAERDSTYDLGFDGNGASDDASVFADDGILFPEDDAEIPADEVVDSTGTLRPVDVTFSAPLSGIGSFEADAARMI